MLLDLFFLQFEAIILRNAPNNFEIQLDPVSIFHIPQGATHSIPILQSAVFLTQVVFLVSAAVTLLYRISYYK
jgi:hypothetical protein